MSSDDPKYIHYYSKAKRLFNQKRYEECLVSMREAFSIAPSEKLQTQINKIEALFEEDKGDDIQFKGDKNKLQLEDKYSVNEDLYNKLYDYQKAGVLWLFKVFESKKGCILADDMGLGKTVQMIFFIRELFESEMIKTALIIMPKSLLVNWEREIAKWAPSISLLSYFGNNKDRTLQKIQKRGGIMITTYGTIMNSWDQMNFKSDFKWGILVLDEGHKIKNPSSKTFKSINTLKAQSRIVMTGTAVQNNLKELWALLDFTHQGSLLGTYPTFNRMYEKPITDSRKKDASQNEKLYGDQISLSLKKLIKPFFLRRTKEEINNRLSESNQSIAFPKMSAKNDIVVWITMTENQIKSYKNMLEADKYKIMMLKSEKRSPLLELNVLKKICDHPRLLKSEQQDILDLQKFNSIDDMNVELLTAESGKMSFLVKLLMKLVAEDHKCLIFSQSKVILNIIQHILRKMRIKMLRLDGDTLKAEDRQLIVDDFNSDPSINILLLTSQVGGVGLTMTGADRVIIYDLNWNPSIDAQSVDRAYRIGQTRNVIVYRLITCGTVEEKIYRRQIFKDSLNRQTTGIQKTDSKSYRYFTNSELFELFVLNDPHQSDTQIQLDQMHSHQRNQDEYLDSHVNWLQDQGIFGISHHDLLFTKQDEDIHVDQETKDRISATTMEAEHQLIREAQMRDDDVSRLNNMMTNIDLNAKSKMKEQYLMENMFIPSKDHLTRPVFNQSKKRSLQPTIDNFVSINKTGSYFGTNIDLTHDIEQQAPVQKLDLKYEEQQKENLPVVIDSDSDDDEVEEAGSSSHSDDDDKVEEAASSSHSDNDDKVEEAASSSHSDDDSSKSDKGTSKYGASAKKTTYESRRNDNLTNDNQDSSSEYDKDNSDEESFPAKPNIRYKKNLLHESTEFIESEEFEKPQKAPTTSVETRTESVEYNMDRIHLNDDQTESDGYYDDHSEPDGIRDDYTKSDANESINNVNLQDESINSDDIISDTDSSEN